MTTVKNYLSLVKFSHTIFAMPFALIGFFLGSKLYINYFNNPFSFLPDKPIIAGWHTTIFPKGYNNMPITLSDFLIKLLLVLICMITARSAAMAFNRYLDRSFDAKNPRTAIREIPKGIISPSSALRFVFLNAPQQAFIIHVVAHNNFFKRKCAFINNDGCIFSFNNK